MRELATAEFAGGGPIRAGSEDIMDEPSGDELIPYVSKEGSAAHSSSPYLDSGWDGNRNGQHADFSGNPATP